MSKAITPFSKQFHSYHSSIRNYTSVFGWIFSDFHISRGENKFVKVPITFARGYKYEKINQDADSRDVNRLSVLPFFAFDILDITRDETRMMNRNNRHNHFPINNNGDAVSMLGRTAVNITYELTARVKNIDDALQIIEQITAVFNPSYTVIMADINLNILDINQSVPIVLENMRLDDSNDLGEETRIIEAIFTFTLKGYLYGRDVEVATINQIDLVGIIDTEEFLLDSLNSSEEYGMVDQLVSEHSAVTLPISDSVKKLSGNKTRTNKGR